MTAAFAILAYDGIEPIDIGATYRVLSMAKRIVPDLAFFVVSKAGGEIVMANGLRLIADHGFADAPPADILMVLGGPGWVEASADAETLAYIRGYTGTVAAVCTGGMIVGAAGLLDGRRATTKREIVTGEARPLDLLAARPQVEVLEARLVDEGAVLTGGGVSLGIDMTLHLIARTCGEEAAAETARILEYATAWEANKRTFAAV
jgi:transcriptional regulator GlxA family with amidase domain